MESTLRSSSDTRSAIFALILLAGSVARAAAQDWLPLGTTDEEAYETAFQAVMAAPTDERALARYANAATRVGNLESAIATLERILALVPGLHPVRLELAVLYARIRATEMARARLEEIVAAPDAPPDLRERAQRLIDEMERRERYGVLSGSLSLGARYQTNANAGTDSSVIRDAGFDFPTPSDRREEDDVNGFFLASASHVLDLGTDHGIPLVTNGATYWTRQADLDEIDLGVLEITSGPRLPLLPASIDRLTLRPFGLGGFSLLHDELNNYEYGGGAELEKRVGLHSAVTLTYSGRQRDFDVQEDRTGFTHRVGAVGVVSITTDVATAIGGSWADESAREGFRSNHETRAFIRGTVRYDPPLGMARWPWHASLQLRWIGTDDRRPDDRVDPFVEREDDEWEVIGRNTFWLSSELALFVEAEHVVSESNLSTGEFDNTTVALGTLWSF
jgi:hypothetical protein